MVDDDAALIRDAYDRRIAALHDTLRAWAAAHEISVGPADSWAVTPGRLHVDTGDYSMDLTRNDRRVTVRLLPSWEQEGFGAPNVIVENESEALRMITCSGDSGMPTAAAMKGLLTGLLMPETL